MGYNSLFIYLLCHLVGQYLEVRQRYGNSRTSIMDCRSYKLKRKSNISEEELFIGHKVTLKINLLNTLKISSLT